jgi:hypothetical protein
LRARLDALTAGRVPRASALGARWFRLTAGEEPPGLDALEALDRALDRVGVHTSADAQLLRTLAVQKGRVADLKAGLARRAEDACETFSRHLRWLEGAQSAQRLPPGALTQAEHAFPKLARVAKLADCFAATVPQPFSLDLPGGAGSPSSSAEVAAPRRPSQPRMAVAAFLAARARANATDTPQKRRDLDRAHELLLRMGRQLDREAFHRLRLEVTAARESLREERPPASLTATLKEVRSAASKDPGRAWSLMRGLYARAVEAQDAALAQATHQALAPLLREAGSAPSRAGVTLEAPAEAEAKTADEKLLGAAFALDDGKRALFDLAAGCARYFDVEDTLSEEVVAQELRKARQGPRRVPYPTQSLVIDTTNAFDELGNFVISDPRSILYDVASGRQLVRAYVTDEPPPEKKKMKRTAVRVYVCDASGSMQGARARFRDAIVLAELANLRRKALAGEPFDPIYFTFFNDQPRELARVDNAHAANRHLRRLFQESPAEGQTDITLALMAAFDSIRAARGTDPYLARATVVLVTDGEDRVELELLRKERAPMDGLHIALSFISLGEENPDLRALVEEEREAGVRAFYHHLTDAEIASAPTDVDARFRTLLPQELTPSPDALEGLLANLEQLDLIAQGKGSEEEVRARPQASFDALFPITPPEGVSKPGASQEDASAEDCARVADLLDAVAEAASLALAEERAQECVTLLEHLLGLYEIPVPRYLKLLSTGEARVEAAVDRVRLLGRPYG